MSIPNNLIVSVNSNSKLKLKVTRLASLSNVDVFFIMSQYFLLDGLLMFYKLDSEQYIDKFNVLFEHHKCLTVQIFICI